jgi:hypothetical protein
MGQAYDSRQIRYGFDEQTTFITPLALNSNLLELTCDPVDVDPGITIHELPQQHGSRDAVEQTTKHSTEGASAKFAINGPLDIGYFDHVLYAHFQKVVELGDTEFTKTFTPFSTHPDFEADEGHFLTFMKWRPVAATSTVVGGCIAPRIKISGERDGMLMFESSWQGLGPGTDNNTPAPASAWTAPTGANILVFNQLQTATLTKGASLASPVALTLRSFELEHNHEVELLGHDATNGFESYGLKERSGTFSIGLLRDVVADEALVSYKEGEMVQFDLDFGTMTIAVTGKIETIETDGDGLLVEKLNCRILATYSAGTYGTPLQIVLNNSIDRSWPAS